MLAQDTNMPAWNAAPVGKRASATRVPLNKGSWRPTFTFDGDRVVLVDHQDYQSVVTTRSERHDPPHPGEKLRGDVRPAFGPTLTEAARRLASRARPSRASSAEVPRSRPTCRCASRRHPRVGGDLCGSRTISSAGPSSFPRRRGSFPPPRTSGLSKQPPRSLSSPEEVPAFAGTTVDSAWLGEQRGARAEDRPAQQMAYDIWHARHKPRPEMRVSRGLKRQAQLKPVDHMPEIRDSLAVVWQGGV